jgi:hypothetical protein
MLRLRMLRLLERCCACCSSCAHDARPYRTHGGPQPYVVDPTAFRLYDVQLYFKGL